MKKIIFLFLFLLGLFGSEDAQAQCSISASATLGAICAGQTTLLYANGANTYTWSTGSNFPGIAVTPSASTIYTVQGTDALGCISSTTVAVTVDQAVPVITASITNSNPLGPTFVCPGQTIALVASGASTYTWTYGIPNGVPFTPTVGGSYGVTSSNACGTSALTFSSVISFTLINVAVLATADNTVICLGGSVTLNGSGAYNDTWTPNITNNVPFTPTATASYTVAGTYFGCTASAVVGVTVLPLPPVTIVASSSVICKGNSATLTAIGAQSYTWTQVPTAQQNQTVAVVSPSVPTLYTVAGTNFAGCTFTQSQIILVNPTPPFIANIINPGGYICPGLTASLVGIGQGPTTYSWSTGATLAVIYVNPSLTTVYTLTITSLTTGCQITGSITLSVYNPTFVVTGTGTVCSGNPAILSASGAASSYSWSTGALTPTVSVSPLSNTVYSVSGTIGNCVTSQTVGIATMTVPIVTASAARNYICTYEEAVLSASGALSYTWNTGAITPAITYTPGVNNFPPMTSIFIVTGTGPNGCTNSFTVTQGVSDCTGLEQLQNTEIPFTIYPNPNNGRFSIRTEQGVLLHLANELGEVIRTINPVNAEGKDVLISGLAPGIYFITAKKEGRTATRKILVEP